MWQLSFYQILEQSHFYPEGKATYSFQCPGGVGGGGGVQGRGGGHTDGFFSVVEQCINDLQAVGQVCVFFVFFGVCV